MHVRVAPPGGGPRLNAARPQRSRSALSILLVALSACWPAGACHRPVPADNTTFEWTLTPAPPSVGRAILKLQVLDGNRRPVRGARIRVEGHMSHAGMAPVLAPARERDMGVYEAELQFTMRGDWVLLVEGTLPDGAAINHRIDVAGVR